MPTPDLHTDVPPVFPLPGTPAARRRENILRDMRTQPFEGFYFGSSLHSYSTTSGSHYMGQLNASLAGIFNNAWATPWIPPASFGSTPYGVFCMRSSRPNTTDPTGLVASYLPPNWGCRKLDHASANFAFQMEPDGWATCPLWKAQQGGYIRQGETIKPWFIGWSIGQGTTEAAQDTAFGFITRKQAAGATGAIFGGGTLLSNVTTVNLPATSATTGQTFNPNSATHQARELDMPATNGAAGITYTNDTAAPYYNLQLSSAAAPTNYILCAGARWTNETSRYGLTVTSLGLGGAKAGDFLANHSNSWETVRAMCGNRRRVIFIELKCNSAYNGMKARDDNDPTNSYYHLIKAQIDSAITNIGPELIFLMGGGPRVDGTGAQDTEYSRMTGADKQLAELYGDLVCVVNSMLVLERMGYKSSTETMTGYTYKNGWAVTTGYVATDVVGLGDGHNLNFYRCLANHTSAAADKPETGANWQTYWRGHRKYLTSNNSLTVAPDDVVHSGARGSCEKAMVDVSLMFAGLNGGVQPFSLRGRR